MTSRYKFLIIAAVTILLVVAQYYAARIMSASGVALVALLIGISLTGSVSVISLIAAATKNPDKTFDWLTDQFLKGIFGLNG